jgi:hypothetical protein
MLSIPERRLRFYVQSVEDRSLPLPRKDPPARSQVDSDEEDGLEFVGCIGASSEKVRGKPGRMNEVAALGSRLQMGKRRQDPGENRKS